MLSNTCEKRARNESASRRDLQFRGSRLTIVDPETDESTDLPSNFVHTDKLTTNRRRGDFGNIERSQVGGGTDTKSSDDATTVDRSKSSSTVSSKHL